MHWHPSKYTGLQVLMMVPTVPTYVAVTQAASECAALIRMTKHKVQNLTLCMLFCHVSWKFVFGWAVCMCKLRLGCLCHSMLWSALVVVLFVSNEMLRAHSESVRTAVLVAMYWHQGLTKYAMLYNVRRLAEQPTVDVCNCRTASPCRLLIIKGLGAWEA